MISNLDNTQYNKLLKAVASISALYSSQASPLVHYRFIENLFAKTSYNKANLIANKDASFDCVLDNKGGVGIKTFVSNGIVKGEKIAEFNRVAETFEKYRNRSEELFAAVARERNHRILSDAKEHGVDLNKSFYHCLVRKPGGAFVHEEPYELIDIDNLKLIDGHSRYPVFSDGKSEYNYNNTKSTLYKKFKLNMFENSETIELPIISEEKIYDILSNFYNSLSANDFINDEQESFKFINFESDLNELITGNEQNEDFVVLPLYGTRRKKFVEEQSGINAWNAGGRKRKFGECYIPVPAIIHEIRPNFFPPRTHKFKTKLPNGKLITTKLASGTFEKSKAFQSDPLTDLGEWVHDMIDLSKENFYKRSNKLKPYIYEDLVKIGKDSVKIIKVENKEYQYELRTMPVDSFENFITEYKN